MSEDVKVEETNEFIEEAKKLWTDVDGTGAEELQEPTEQAEEIADPTPDASVEEVKVEPIALESEEPTIQLPDIVDFLGEDNQPDLENDLEIDALNYWAGGQRAQWTVGDRKEWSDEQKSSFGKYQSAYDKKNAPVIQETPTETREYTKDEIATATEDLYRLLQGDQGTVEKYKGLADTPETPEPSPSQSPIDRELMMKVSKAFEENDTEAFTENLSNVISDVIKRTESHIAQSKQSAIQEFDDKTKSQTIETRKAQVIAKAKQYEGEYGSDFTRYIPQIADMLDFGDPFSRTQPQDMSLEKAWELCRKYDGGNQSMVKNIPSGQAVAPQGTGSGVEPGITEKDLEGDFVTLARKAYEESQH